MDKYSTLDTVVRQLINEQQLPDERRYGAYIGYAYSFLNGEYPVGNGGGQALKTVPVEVGFDRTAPLPDDYVQYVSLGRVIGNQVRMLAHNPHLAPAGLAQTPAPGVVGYYDLTHAPTREWPCFTFWGWESLGLAGWDGCGWGWGEWREEFALDRDEGSIRLSSAMAGPEGGPLLLCYQSNDLSPGKPTPIHPYWQNALKEYLLWQWYSKAKENIATAREHERLYRQERTKALRRTDPTSYADINAIIYQSYNSLR